MILRFDFVGKRFDLFFFGWVFDFAGHPREGRREADTMILRGVPSRWFAETRVSSKPSMLVAHTIFSTFGKIR